MSGRVRALLLVPIGTLVLAGCGGSSHSSSSATSAATTLTSSAASATTTTSSSASPSTSTASSAPSAPTTTSYSTTPRSRAGSSNVRVPASFVVRAGKLTPPLITVPAFLAVQFTVASGDGRSHHVVLKTPVLHELAVPSHGHATVRIPGLRAGQYQIEVDGSVGGSLVIGGEPGP